MSDEIILKNAVLHILDNNINMPVLSNRELEIDSESSDFLSKHILKIIGDPDIKHAKFISESNSIQGLFENILNNPGEFLKVSCDLANRLFNIMLKNVDIVPADVIFCLFTQNEQKYFCILKLNYKSGFTHYVQNSDNGNLNSIIKHRTILPSEAQKVEESAFICLEDMSIRLIEKEYDIDGKKDFYLSKLFLGCKSDLSNNAKLKIINKVTNKINKKYFDEDFDHMAKMKMAISESLEENSVFKVQQLAEEIFVNNIDIQNEYISEVQKAGLTEEDVMIPEALAEKKYKTHRIKTDTGIEINFPLNYYNNKG